MSASHEGEDGVLHGHTWEIVAWYKGKPDAVMKQRELEGYLSVFTHTILPDTMGRGEDLARYILEDLGCVKVDVNRPLERIYAQVIK